MVGVVGAAIAVLFDVALLFGVAMIGVALWAVARGGRR